jgi:hypothetical protein
MLSGSPLLVLKRRLGMRVLLCLLLAPAILLLLAASVHASIAAHPEPEWTAIFAAMAVGLGVLFAWLFRREATRVTRMYEEGIEQTVSGTTRELYWRDVRQVTFRVVRVQAGGVAGALIGAAIDGARKGPAKPLSESSDNITVRVVADGGTIKLSSNDKGIVQALEEVLRRVNPRLVEEAYSQVRNGQPVAFGKVVLSLEGIRFGGREAIPYADVEKLSIAGGKLTVKKRSAWLSKGGTPIHRIPNVMVLVEVFARMTGGTVPTRAELGRNLAGRVGV